MKKVFTAIVTAGIIAAGLCGCSQTASSTAAGSAQPASSEAVTTSAKAPSAAAAEASSAAMETSSAAAEKPKGAITLYTSQPEADAQVLIDGFHKVYPDIEVKVFRSGTEEVISKVLAEKQVGALQADVLLVADSVTFESLKEQDLMMSYESPELNGIPEEFIDKDHTYTGTKVISTGIIYNTDLVKEVPAGFASLTGDFFKENVIMPSPLYSGAAAYNLGVMTRTESLGWDFYNNLKAGGVTVDKGNGAVQKAVVAGEKAAGILVDYMAIRSKNDGAPIEFVYPEEGSPCVTEPIGILKDTKNADQAKAFVDFVLSEDGQKLASSIGYTPIKEGVPAPEGLKNISELKTMSYDIRELYQNRETDKQQFSKLFQ